MKTEKKNGHVIHILTGNFIWIWILKSGCGSKVICQTNKQMKIMRTQNAKEIAKHITHLSEPEYEVFIQVKVLQNEVIDEHFTTLKDLASHCKDTSTVRNKATPTKAPSQPLNLLMWSHLSDNLLCMYALKLTGSVITLQIKAKHTHTHTKPAGLFQQGGSPYPTPYLLILSLILQSHSQGNTVLN